MIRVVLPYHLRTLAKVGAEVKIDVDGDRWYSGHAACVLVGNTGKILGGGRAFPDARFDDGLLDVGVVSAQSRRDWLRVGVRAVTGRIDHSPLVELTQATHIKVRLDHKMPWQLDGGDRPAVKKFDITGKPMKNWVLVEPDGIEQDGQLKGWIQQAMKFVGNLPRK